MEPRSLNTMVFGLIFCALLLCVPVSYAQEAKSSCSSQKQLTNPAANLPVAGSTEEYKAYCDLAAIQSPQEMIAKGQQFLQKYSDSQLRYPLYQNMVTAAIRLNDFDQAFKLGQEALTKFPDHMLVMTQLATIASNQLLMGTNTYAAEGQQYAAKAVELIEAGQMPTGYMPDCWKPYKNNLLGDLYQAKGIFALMNNHSEEAATNLLMATDLHPFEPYTYFLLAKAQIRLLNEGRTDAITAGLTNQPTTLSEQIVKTYARATVLTEGEKYKSLRSAIDYDLQTLSKVLPTLKTNLAQSIDAARNEMNAMAKPPAAQ